LQQVVAAAPSPEAERPSKREHWIISGNGKLPLTKAQLDYIGRLRAAR
jgi:hypothetical protein